MVTGQFTLSSPSFLGEYHAFFGDFMGLLLQGAGSLSQGAAAYCVAVIKGSISQQGLAITAFRAEVRLYF